MRRWAKARLRAASRRMGHATLPTTLPREPVVAMTVTMGKALWRDGGRYLGRGALRARSLYFSSRRISGTTTGPDGPGRDSFRPWYGLVMTALSLAGRPRRSAGKTLATAKARSTGARPAGLGSLGGVFTLSVALYKRWYSSVPARAC